MRNDGKADLSRLICHASVLFDTIEMLAIEASDGRLKRNVLGSIEVLATVGRQYMEEIEGNYDGTNRKEAQA